MKIYELEFSFQEDDGSDGYGLMTVAAHDEAEIHEMAETDLQIPGFQITKITEVAELPEADLSPRTLN